MLLKQYKSHIKFRWNWPVSGESGGGIFYWPRFNFLIGGWWIDGDHVNERELIKAHGLADNHWTFRRYRDFGVSEAALNSFRHEP
jgi:hypothetical protein